MSEIMERKYIKKISSFGIPKLKAKEIVQLANETGKGKNIENYIVYAIELQYGLGIFNNNKFIL